MLDPVQAVEIRQLEPSDIPAVVDVYVRAFPASIAHFTADAGDPEVRGPRWAGLRQLLADLFGVWAAIEPEAFFVAVRASGNAASSGATESDEGRGRSESERTARQTRAAEGRRLAAATEA